MVGRNAQNEIAIYFTLVGGRHDKEALFISVDIIGFLQGHHRHEIRLANHILQVGLLLCLFQQVNANHSAHSILGLAFPAFLGDSQGHFQSHRKSLFFELYMEFGVVQPGFIAGFFLKWPKVQMAAAIGDILHPTTNQDGILFLVESVELNRMVRIKGQLVVAKLI